MMLVSSTHVKPSLAACRRNVSGTKQLAATSIINTRSSFRLWDPSLTRGQREKRHAATSPESGLETAPAAWRGGCSARPTKLSLNAERTEPRGGCDTFPSHTSGRQRSETGGQCDAAGVAGNTEQRCDWSIKVAVVGQSCLDWLNFVHCCDLTP